MTLTQPMVKLLDRGLNFCVTPSTLNITQIKVDFDKFERRVLWKEWWFGRKDEEIEIKKPKSLFPTESTHLPPKGMNAVKNFLTGIRSETLGIIFTFI